jgi:hypothetical protein
VSAVSCWDQAEVFLKQGPEGLLGEELTIAVGYLWPESPFRETLSRHAPGW